jgi:hypothetical protein
MSVNFDQDWTLFRTFDNTLEAANENAEPTLHLELINL